MDSLYTPNRYDSDTAVFRRIIATLGVSPTARLLDFGCGEGHHLASYLRAGFDAHGCDVVKRTDRASVIETPYRLPYADRSFDVVVSSGVLEHAQNTEQVFRELHRVMRPGAVALHLFPTRWYLPREPHIYVPLANWFRPVPRWYLKAWAMLGVRNEYQRGMSAEAVTVANLAFCRAGLHYLSCREIERLSRLVFGHVEWRSPHPGRPLWLRHFRMGMVVQRRH